MAEVDNTDFENLYNQAVEEMETAKSIANFKAVEEKFRRLGDFKDSVERAEQCHERQRFMTYKTALYEIKCGWKSSLESAMAKLESIIDYEDSAEQLQKCRERLSAPVRTDFTFIIEIAALISDNDQQVITNLTDAIKAPKKYFKQNTVHFRRHGMEIEDYVFSKKEPFDYSRSMDEVLWVAMIDELREGGYLFEPDSDRDTGDFIYKLRQMKAFDLISRDVSDEEIDDDNLYGLERFFGEIDLNHSNDDPWNDDWLSFWCEQLNALLDGQAVVAYVDSDIDFNFNPLIIVTHEVLAKINKIAEENGHRFLTFDEGETNELQVP